MEMKDILTILVLVFIVGVFWYGLNQSGFSELANWVLIGGIVIIIVAIAVFILKELRSPQGR